MSIPKKIDEHQFALAVVSSIAPKGNSPESIAEEQLENYLAAYAKAHEFNNPDSNKPKLNALERAQRLSKL